VQGPTNTAQVFSRPNSPCPFNITFTGTGGVAITTYLLRQQRHADPAKRAKQAAT
jgi:hypothetical protein